MPMDFTVIQAVRQRFGEVDETGAAPTLEQDAPFVGKSKGFPFSCPNVAAEEWAVLQFISFGVMGQILSFMLDNQAARNIIRINGKDIPGGITPDPRVEPALHRVLPFWTTHSLLVPPNLLKEDNVLYIQAKEFGDFYSADRFIIDNVIIFFKTLVRTGTVAPPIRERG